MTSKHLPVVVSIAAVLVGLAAGIAVWQHHSSAQALRAGVSLTASVAGKAMTPAQAKADKGANYTNGCHISREGTAVSDSPDCIFGDTASATTVVLYGDSHAAQWFPAMLKLAQENSWRLIPITKVACPPGSAVVFNSTLNAPYDQCAKWHTSAMDRIAGQAPKIVVVASRAEYYEVMGNSAPKSVRRSALVLESGLAEDLGVLTSSGARVFMLRDTPVPGFNVPDCIGKKGASNCSYNLADATPDDAGQRAAAKDSDVPVIDVNKAICGGGTNCATEFDGVITFRDDDHLAATFAGSLAPEIAIKIK